MGWRNWTGVGERRWKTAPDEQVQPSKTLWDLLQLLIVPVILIGVSLWWSASQDSRDKSRADQVRQDTTLNDYIEQMSDLMLNKSLLSSKKDDAVRSVARTVTLTTLRRLDGSRQGEVVRFLKEARLIERGELVESRTLVRLDGANLSFADIKSADLRGADFTGADLTNSDLSGAFLPYADLSSAHLRGADLSSALLTGATLTDADLIDSDLSSAELDGAHLFTALLRGANLTGADLSGRAFLEYADLTRANLTDANLTGADLRGADLSHADLTGANLKDADLTHAILKGAKGLPKRRR